MSERAASVDQPNESPAGGAAVALSAPTCPTCGNPLTRVVDVPYGWWEWNEERGRYVACTAATRVDVAPWVHVDCWGELRRFHPQDPVGSAAAS